MWVAPNLTDDSWGQMGLTIGTIFYAEVVSIGVFVLGLLILIVEKVAKRNQPTTKSEG